MSWITSILNDNSLKKYSRLNKQYIDIDIKIPQSEEFKECKICYNSKPNNFIGCIQCIKLICYPCYLERTTVEYKCYYCRHRNYDRLMITKLPNQFINIYYQEKYVLTSQVVI